MSRRTANQAAAALATAHVAGCVGPTAQTTATKAPDAEPRAQVNIPLQLQVNRQSYAIKVDSRTTVLDARGLGFA